MWKRKRTWLLLVLLLTLGVGVYFEPSYCVRGSLHGEAFFEGRPTSYWRNVVVRDLEDPDRFLFGPPIRVQPPSWWQRCKDWVGYRPHVDNTFELFRNDAAPVLRELANDATPQVAVFAQGVIDSGARSRLEQPE